MATSGRSRQKILGRPPFSGVALYLAAKRPLDRARERSRPVRSRSLRQVFGGMHYARFHDANNQDWSHYRLHAAPWQPHQLISGRAPSARTKILHNRGSSAPRSVKVRFAPEPCAFQVGRPFRIAQVANSLDKGLPIVAGAGRMRDVAKRGDRICGFRQVIKHPLGGCGSDAGQKVSVCTNFATAGETRAGVLTLAA